MEGTSVIKRSRKKRDRSGKNMTIYGGNPSCRGTASDVNAIACGSVM